MSIKLSAFIGLKDQFTPNLENLTKKGKQQYRKMERQVESFKKSFKKSMTSITNYAKAMSIGAVLGIGKFLNDSRQAFNAYNLEVTKFMTLIKNTKGFTQEQGQALVEYASNLQKVGVMSDTNIIAGMQQISTFQLQAKNIKRLTEGMADLVAQQKGTTATSQDFVNVGNLIGKVMSGQTGALSKAGIIFNKAQEQILKYGNETQRATVLAQVLKDNVGGVNKALLNTPEGAMKNLKNQFEDMQKALGQKIQPILNIIMQKIIEKMPIIRASMDKVINKLEELAPIIAENVGNAIEIVFSGLFKFIELLESIGKYKNIIMPLIGSFIAFKVVLGGLNAVHTTITAMKAAMTLFTITTNGATMAVKILNIVTTVLGGPFSLIALAIVGVGTAIYLLYTRCETFRNVVNKVIGFIIKLFKLWFNMVKTIAIGIGSFIKKLFNGVMVVVKWYFDTWVKIILFVKEKFLMIFDFIKNFIGTVKDFIIAGVGKAFEFVGDIFKKIFGWISKITDGLKGAFSKIKSFFSQQKDININTNINNNAKNNIMKNGSYIPKANDTINNSNTNNNTNKKENKKNNVINATVNIQGNVIGNKQFANEITEHILSGINTEMRNI